MKKLAIMAIWIAILVFVSGKVYFDNIFLPASTVTKLIDCLGRDDHDCAAQYWYADDRPNVNIPELVKFKVVNVHPLIGIKKPVKRIVYSYGLPDPEKIVLVKITKQPASVDPNTESYDEIWSFSLVKQSGEWRVFAGRRKDGE